MIQSFLKIAFRYLWRNKTYSILNFLCLTFGITCSIVAVLYIMNIFRYDRFHKNYKRLYEIESTVTYFNGARFAKEPQSASLRDVLEKNIPEIESISRITGCSYQVISGDKMFSENGIYADENFFSLFTFPLISADSQNLLTDINSILISERMAKKLFGSTDCLGKTVLLKKNDSNEAFRVRGVLKDIPSQSLLQFGFIIPFSKFLAGNDQANETGASVCSIWVLPRLNANISAINSKVKDLIKKQQTTLNQELFLFPLKEKILYSYSSGKRVWNEMQRVIIVGSIGFAILLIACFNFVNLAIALNIRRYREVGIKKVAGAKRSTIIIQFLCETFIIVLISLVTAIMLSRLLLGGFNAMFNGDIHLKLNDLHVIAVFAGIALFTGFLSGILPSVYLSSFNPVGILKAEIISGHSFSFFRQSLIVFQFIIPVVLIICMLVIKVQESFMSNFDLGFNRDKLIVLNSTGNLAAHEETLKADLLAIPGVESVSLTNCIPTRGTRVSNEVSWEGKDVNEKLHFWCISTDFNYSRAVGIKMISGRYFDKSFPADSSCYVINDIAASIMKFDNPVGTSLTLDGKKGIVIGVFKDFHTVDLRGPYTPVIISVNSNDRNTLLIRFSASNYSALTGRIAEVYKRYEGVTPYNPVLFSDLPDFAGLKNTSGIVALAFIIALILACLGLSGLASFTAEKRTKEIGIRKTNGATTLSIMKLLLKNYSKWLAIAFVIALPVSFLISRIFLSRFYFRSPMPYWVYIAGPALAYTVALLTVGVQSWRAASRNPVESLVYE